MYTLFLSCDIVHAFLLCLCLKQAESVAEKGHTCTCNQDEVQEFSCDLSLNSLCKNEIFPDNMKKSLFHSKKNEKRIPEDKP